MITAAFLGMLSVALGAAVAGAVSAPTAAVRGVPPTGGDLSLLEPATENAELRLQLAEAQDQCIELAVDAGELHVEITALRVRLAHVEKQRDAWQAQAECLGRAVA
jgi:hypothetical protein